MPFSYTSTVKSKKNKFSLERYLYIRNYMTVVKIKQKAMHFYEVNLKSAYVMKQKTQILDIHIHT